jgi:hypothetical protein
MFLFSVLECDLPFEAKATIHLCPILLNRAIRPQPCKRIIDLVSAHPLLVVQLV